MPSLFRERLSTLFLFVAVLIPSAWAEEPLVSTMQNVRAVMEARGFFITPAQDLSGEIIIGDESPVMAMEIIRPKGEKISIGRLFTSCSCIQLEADKRTFDEGERAILRLRNVRPTTPTGQIYAIYVQLTGPLRTTLRYDTFLRSSRFTSQPAPTAAPVFAASGQGEDDKDADDRKDDEDGEAASGNQVEEKDPLDKYSPAPEAAAAIARGETEAFKATEALLELKRREAAEAAENIRKTETLLQLKQDDVEKADELVKRREEELEAAEEAVEEARRAAALRVSELKAAGEELAAFRQEKELRENEARKAAVAVEALKEVGK